MQKITLEDVNIINILAEVVNHNNDNYQSDFEYDKLKLLTTNVGDSFVWLSRRNGTWLFNERDVYINSTSSHNTWSYYGGSKSENIRAYLVEITSEENNQPIGTVTEMDYEKHLDYLTMHSVTPTSVELLFNNPSAFREFRVSEYHQNTQEITRRYGNIERATYKVDNEYELQRIMKMAREQIKENSLSMDSTEYFYDMEKKEFEEHGFDMGDNAFLNHKDAEDAITYKLNVRAITQTGEEIQVRNMDDYYQQIGTTNIFTTSKEEKGFLQYLQNSNTPLFTQEENELIFDCVLQAAKENKVENLVTLDTVLYKLEHLIEPLGEQNELALSQELETEHEQ
ncbi:MAG: hypothetical protein R3Y47_12795 [Lachnospiraceae bacterium]